MDENKTEEDVRSSEAVHTRFGRRIQFPKKYAEDLKLEIRQTEILVISINFVIGERCRELNPYVLSDYAYVIL